MPGPLAAQLAIYLGYVHYGITGATLAGVAFVIPSFIMVVALGAAYVAYGGLTWMQAVFYGVGAAGGRSITRRAFQIADQSISDEKELRAVCPACPRAGLVTPSPKLPSSFTG